ncbi:MAG: GlsB/YeaQ/YmgE family stress response membrane protein [Rhizobiales bacterium]|nr:GlsB/YeaQ/YmgE family stress response membrane protein [Hyphomicrobiales bacterium]
MDAKSLIVMLIVGVVAGWLASFVVGGGSLVRYLVTGLIGAVAGGFLFQQLGISLGINNEIVRQIIVATVGAIVVVLLARLIA